jgi:hypothetical protein
MDGKVCSICYKNILLKRTERMENKANYDGIVIYKSNTAF